MAFIMALENRMYESSAFLYAESIFPPIFTDVSSMNFAPIFIETINEKTAAVPIDKHLSPKEGLMSAITTLLRTKFLSASITSLR